MATCRSSSSSQWGMDRPRYDISAKDGLQCRCADTVLDKDREWNYNECQKINGLLRWTKRHFCCGAGSAGPQFRQDCEDRGSNCYIDVCRMSKGKRFLLWTWEQSTTLTLREDVEEVLQ